MLILLFSYLKLLFFRCQKLLIFQNVTIDLNQFNNKYSIGSNFNCCLTTQLILIKLLFSL